ncbi:hypothetical protein DV096_09465 [Bradymonadaceae bacterium TMQ3]|uniref:Uncharacterized protein n=1 Tax=Lujinxingia sediminis TaxID=2480984 RepID=A0ABY0CPD5_9DELT|nr:hypothetical protein [Lujinxingia sediminis]RDV38033.1 hypothetical protein DV096_09465 [Bradymonadaceae bacterium TMQ3]RVU42297.1 hypothetical protein EA187_17065 [Lujinxingia sediminis]
MRNRLILIGSMVLAGVIVTIATPGKASAQQAIFEFDEIVVEGRIQKPEAFYIIQAANLSYEPVDPKPSFLPELLESVEEEPF